MVALAIRFHTGRFHATPWGRHVNEAAPEWPPSPWRLLRGLVATWKRKADGLPACRPDVVERLLRSLASPPQFVLPPAGTGHFRHYMPWFKKGPADRTLVFDSFVTVGCDDPVVSVWPDVRLEEDERRALEIIAGMMGFLGRAESWADVRVLADGEGVRICERVNCVPVGVRAAGKNDETVRVLCVDPERAFENTYMPRISPCGGKGKPVAALHEPNWHLCMETLELHRQGWSEPPGATWVTYLRRKDSLAVSRARPHRLAEQMRPTAVRFMLDGTVLPLVTDTLRVAETMRRTVMGVFRRVEERRLYGGPAPEGNPLPRSDVFCGKDARGLRLEGHRHAYYLPTDEDNDGRIDHVTIVAGMGFGPEEVRAFDTARTLKLGDREPLGLLLLAIGVNQAVTARCVLGPSRYWVSATPFVATRHPKARGTRRDPPELLDNQREFARRVLVEELDRWRARNPGTPPPTAVESLNEEHRCGAHRLRPIQFKRFRQKRSDDGGRRAAGVFRIVFPRPVPGPIAVGHSSHFGLGLFVRESER